MGPRCIGTVLFCAVLIAGCSSGGDLHGVAFDPIGGRLTGIFEHHGACLGLVTAPGRQAVAVALTHGYGVKGSPMRITNSGGQTVARAGQNISAAGIGQPRPSSGCGSGHARVLLDGKSIHVVVGSG